MRILSVVAVIVAAHHAGAQTRPPIREIGTLERVTTDSLRSVVEALPMSGGRVLVNDPWSRRVQLFDSTLSHPITVADTTSATGNAYGTHRGGTIMRYRGDSALYIDEAALTMFVVTPSGTLGRLMAFPQPPTKDAGGQLITAGESGPPGFDARGRLIYVNETNSQPGSMTLSLSGTMGGIPADAVRFGPNMYADSSFAFRVDLVTRKTDTIAVVKRGGGIMRLRLEADRISAIENAFDPLPVRDQWAMLPDGAFAVVRGRDYHIDWLDGGGKWTSTPKMPFDWQAVSDDRKRELLDSTERAWRKQKDEGGGGGRGGRGGTPVPNTVIRLPLDEVSSYIPPLERGSVRADADGNVWIRTSTRVRDRPVYDVVDRRGEIIDRIQLPANRVIAGFGPGVIYMVVLDAAHKAQLERARIK